MRQIVFLMLIIIAGDVAAMEPAMSAPSLYQLCIKTLVRYIVHDNYLLELNEQKRAIVLNLLKTDAYSQFAEKFQHEAVQHMLTIDQPRLQPVNSGSFRDVIFSPTGNLILINTVHVDEPTGWDIFNTRTGEQLGSLSVGSYEKIRVSPNDQCIALLIPGTLSLYTLAGKEYLNHPMLPQITAEFVFSPDGSWLVINDYVGNAYVYQTSDGRLYRTYPIREGEFASGQLDFNADADYLLLDDEENKKIIDIKNDKIVLQLDAHTKGYFHPTIVNRLYVVNNKDIELYELTPFGAIKTQILPNTYQVGSLQFNASGDRYFVCFLTKRELWKTKDHQFIRGFDMIAYEPLNIDPSFRYYERNGTVIDIDQNRVIQFDASNVKFGKDFSIRKQRAGYVHIWHLATGRYYASIPRNGFARLSPNGTQIIVQNRRQLQLWNISADYAQASGESLLKFLLFEKQWLANQQLDPHLFDQDDQLKPIVQKIGDEDIDTSSVRLDKNYSGKSYDCDVMTLMGYLNDDIIMCDSHKGPPFPGKLQGFYKHANGKTNPLTFHQAYKAYHTMLEQFNKMSLADKP